MGRKTNQSSHYRDMKRPAVPSSDPNEVQDPQLVAELFDLLADHGFAPNDSNQSFTKEEEDRFLLDAFNNGLVLSPTGERYHVSSIASLPADFFRSIGNGAFYVADRETGAYQPVIAELKSGRSPLTYNYKPDPENSEKPSYFRMENALRANVDRLVKDLAKTDGIFSAASDSDEYSDFKRELKKLAALTSKKNPTADEIEQIGKQFGVAAQKANGYLTAHSKEKVPTLSPNQVERLKVMNRFLSVQEAFAAAGEKFSLTALTDLCDRQIAENSLARNHTAAELRSADFLRDRAKYNAELARLRGVPEVGALLNEKPETKQKIVYAGDKGMADYYAKRSAAAQKQSKGAEAKKNAGPDPKQNAPKKPEEAPKLKDEKKAKSEAPKAKTGKKDASIAKQGSICLDDFQKYLGRELSFEQAIRSGQILTKDGKFVPEDTSPAEAAQMLLTSGTPVQEGRTRRFIHFYEFNEEENCYTARSCEIGRDGTAHAKDGSGIHPDEFESLRLDADLPLAEEIMQGARKVAENLEQYRGTGNSPSYDKFVERLNSVKNVAPDDPKLPHSILEGAAEECLSYLESHKTGKISAKSVGRLKEMNSFLCLYEIASEIGSDREIVKDRDDFIRSRLAVKIINGTEGDTAAMQKMFTDHESYLENVKGLMHCPAMDAMMERLRPFGKAQEFLEKDDRLVREDFKAELQRGNQNSPLTQSIAGEKAMDASKLAKLEQKDQEKLARKLEAQQTVKQKL